MEQNGNRTERKKIGPGHGNGIFKHETFKKRNKKNFFKFIFDSNAERGRSARIIFKLLFYKKTEKTIPFD